MIKVLVFGAGGFVGRSIAEGLQGTYEVIRAYHTLDVGDGYGGVDMNDPTAIGNVLSEERPDVIVNGAGVTSNDESANQNPIFVKNLLEQVLATNLHPERIITLGSAAEYGTLESGQLPVSEDTPVHATSAYGLSKIAETKLALEYRTTHQLPIVVARIFNPLGHNMPPRMILPRLLNQVTEIRRGERDAIEVNRVDAMRDYIAMSDVAAAISAIISGEPQHAVYNVGSGVATSNGQLIDMVLKASGLADLPEVRETASEPEPIVASQADISRLQSDFGWQIHKDLSAIVEEVINGK